ncbi:MAG TPA: hypothetical protein VH593_24265, partial [Ktedonobacteraceae bacterium]
MVATRIFICHDLDLQEETRLEVQIFKQMCQRLRSVQAEVVLYTGHASDDGFLTFFYQQILACQWFLLFQTESAARVSSIQSAVSIAKTRVDQKQMQGILRFIAPPSEAREQPPLWSTLPTFGPTPDYQRALEELLLALPLSLGQEAPVKADSSASPPVAILEATEEASATPYNQLSFYDPPPVAVPPPPVVVPPPSAVNFTASAPFSARSLYEQTQGSQPVAALRNSASKSTSDRPVKLSPVRVSLPPVRVSKKQIVLSTVIAAVLILTGLMFTMVLPLYASGAPSSAGSPTSVSTKPGIGHTTNTTTPGAQASATANAQAAANAQATANAQAAANAQATAFASTPQGLYVVTTGNAPNVADSLAGQSGLGWDVFTYSGGGGCGYTGGAYHATMPQSGAFASCMAETTNYSNFLYQVSMTVLSGSQADGGGLIFRTAGNVQYRLHIGIDGSYDLVTPAQSLVSSTSSAIKTGVGQTNLVAIAAYGGTINIYINGTLIDTLTDTT